MSNEETISNGLRAFTLRWGLAPNGILIHPKTHKDWEGGFVGPGTFHFNGLHIPIFRSPDVPQNEIKFVL